MDVGSATNQKFSNLKVQDTDKNTKAALSLQPYFILRQKQNFELSISDVAMVKAIDKANKAIAGSQKKFEYSVHQPTGDIIVKVLDADTNEVIRELPPEKYLDLIDKLQEISGVIIDEKR